MITSRQIINEVYLTLQRFGSVTAPVYKNPSTSDYIAMYKESLATNERKLNYIRFIANAKTKSVYVWDGYRIVHEIVRSKLNMFDNFFNTPWILDGAADYSSGKAVAKDWHKFDTIPKELMFASSRRGYDDPETDSSINNSYINWAFQTLLIDWSFVDKYVSGTNSMMKLYKSKFNKYLERERYFIAY